MPTYVFKCSQCEKGFEEFLSIAERNTPKENPCPSCGAVGSIDQVIGAPRLNYTTTSARTDSDFNDRLKQISKNIPERYRSNVDKHIH